MEIIPNPAELQKIKRTIKEEGKENLHIISDFDRTLTYGLVNKKPAPALISLLRKGNYLTENYAPRAYALFDKYHPIEISTTISKQEKNEKMMEWWKAHFSLLIECGLNKETIKKASMDARKEGIIKLRKGVKEFLKTLSDNNIPIVILSSGIGDMIEEILNQENCLYKNISIIGNNLEFDKNGKAIKIKKIIHVFNKHEAEIKSLPIYKELENRKNVILLGDSLGDLKMIEGFAYKNLIKIGFLNENVDMQLKEFKDNFDIVLLEDQNFSYVNSLLKKIIK